MRAYNASLRDANVIEEGLKTLIKSQKANLRDIYVEPSSLLFVYNNSTVDLSAMKEVIYRRYFRVLMDNLEKPDLIIVDGGELQVNVAKEIIDSLGLQIKVIGLKKNDKHRTSSIINSDLSVIDVDPKSNLFLFLTRIQDEVHNFAISYHRTIKAHGMLSSLLDMVEGIGEVRKKELLKKYGSLKKIKEADKEELEKILSKNVADNLIEYLKKIES